MRSSCRSSSSRYTANALNRVSRAINCGILARSSSRSRTDVTSRPSSNSVESSSVSVGGLAGPAALADSGLVTRCPDYTERFLESLTLPLDYSAIERILPHRFPFLLVDRITELEPDKRIVGIKNVSLNERYLADQPGEMRALPPTILTECVAQVGAILILWKPENYLRGADICANNLEIPMAMADGAVLQMIEESILTPAVIEEAIDQLFNMVQQPSKDGDERANNLQTEIERL